MKSVNSRSPPGDRAGFSSPYRLSQARKTYSLTPTRRLSSPIRTSADALSVFISHTLPTLDQPLTIPAPVRNVFLRQTLDIQSIGRQAPNDLPRLSSWWGRAPDLARPQTKEKQ